MEIQRTDVSQHCTNHPPTLHTKFSTLLHRKREIFFFFSDPPHLAKTVRNCWESRKCSLWVRMCTIWCTNVQFCTLQYNRKTISWSHLTKFYDRDTAPGVGIRMVPKLKFEHISLISFSKMHVDLAAQVCTAPSEPMYGSIYKHTKIARFDGIFVMHIMFTISPMGSIPRKCFTSSKDWRLKAYCNTIHWQMYYGVNFCTIGTLRYCNTIVIHAFVCDVNSCTIVVGRWFPDVPERLGGIYAQDGWFHKDAAEHAA